MRDVSYCFYFLQIIVACFLLQACQLVSFSEPEEKIADNSLASLQPAVINLPKTQQSDLSVSDVIEHYSALLPLLDDPEKQLKVLHRLADLKLQKGELLMAEHAKDELDIAISAYLGLLEKYPQRTKNDEVLYQLAKTYELKGEAEKHLTTLTRLVTEYPETRYLAEVQFRRGEILFAWSEYALAQEAFDAVSKTKNETFLSNAYYMLGWSMFKQNDYDDALLMFSKVLDRIFSQHSDVIISDLTHVEAHQATLVNDLLRVMGLSFSYLDGAQSLAVLFDRIGARHYEVMIYAHYSRLLIEKELFTNAIDVYRAYIHRHPMNLWAARFHIHIIDTLDKANFRASIYDEKVRFVQSFGLNTKFWHYHQGNPTEIPAYAVSDHLAFSRQYLEIFLIELADISYIKGQQAEKKRIKGAKVPSQAMTKHFAQSGRYNQQFIDTFPDHSLVAKRLFLLAESEFKLQHWLNAIRAFERAGYQYPDFSDASEAAYAVVLAYTKLSQTWAELSPEHLAEWQHAEQVNRLRFVAFHAKDARAVDVLFVALRYQFLHKHYVFALNNADKLIHWVTEQGTPRASKFQRQESYLIKAHSLYALMRYQEAENAYQHALLNLNKQDERRLALVENLAASVYKQAEILLNDDKKDEAIQQLLRVGLVAPRSTLRQNASYDAANYLLELKKWPEAIGVLTDFRTRYPQHALIDSLPAKLALAYRETEQWSFAADELKRMAALANTAQEKQDISFIVAELYDKADNLSNAIRSYRYYANTYPAPADVYMEAANRLAELYVETNVPLKRRFWLAKQMKKVDALGDKADDRMRYLAARASSVLANDAYIQYRAINLSLPLDKSLTRKTKALENALAAYQKTASYGISEFSTEAGFRMAGLYSHLSQALMASDRPDNLNELELEQYDILLEEQVYPFEDSAIDIHEQNASRAWDGLYDKWVKKSFSELRALLPGRYAKDEAPVEVMNVLQ